jgi:hypothetical protein
MSQHVAARNTTTDLLDAIDLLTLPHDVKIIDRGTHIATRRDPGLITQLRHARTANIGPGNGSRAKHERLTLNIEASQLYTEIETLTKQWAIRAGYRREGHPWPALEDLLRAWYARAHKRPHFSAAPHLATIEAWTQRILDLLDPPHRFDIDRPCPICGAHIINIRLDDETIQVRALNGIDRDEHDSTVTCRNCGAIWHGHESARELATELTTKALPVITPEMQHA